MANAIDFYLLLGFIGSVGGVLITGLILYLRDKDQRGDD